MTHHITAKHSNPRLANANISFHTNDEDKDYDTNVRITVYDFHNVVCARIASDFMHFNDNSDAGPYPLTVQNSSTKDLLQRGKVAVHIQPNGHDTWRFSFFLDLIFEDGSHLSGGSTGLQLSQRNQDYQTGLEGILSQ